MIQTSPIQRIVFGKQTYPKVIDTQFKELVPITNDNSQFQTIDYFFNLYNDLFYQIPPLGDTNSHQYLINKSGDFVGIEARSSDVDALIDEINSLRQQLLDANKQIIDLGGKQ